MKSFIYIILLFFLVACIGTKENTLIKKSRNTKAAAAAFKDYDSLNWTIRRKAVINITNYTRKQELPFTEKALIRASKDDHCEIRIVAIKGLRIIATVNAKKRLASLSSIESCNNARWYALQSLSTFKSDVYGSIFKKSYKSSDWIIREASIIGFMSIKNKRYLQKNTSFIQNILNDPIEANRLTALKYLSIKNDKLYLTITSQYNKIPQYRISIIKGYLAALNGYILDAKTREKIINYLIHDNKEIRILSYRVLLNEYKIKKEKGKP